MPQKLTDTAIRAAKAKEKPYKLVDGGGLYLSCTPSGSKLWRLKYHYNKKEKLLSLGAYPAVGLKEARKRAAAAKERLESGVDPSAERKAAKQRAAAAAHTFELVAREWHTRQRPKWTPRHAATVLRMLELYVLPRLGKRLIGELGAPEFVAMLRAIEAKGCVDTARRTARICGRITRYARLTGLVPADAASGLSAAIAVPTPKHHATITDPPAVGALLRALDAYTGDPSICHALRLLPYVFVRSCELREAAWEEISLEKAEWLIPAERMKMKRPHLIPLSRQAVAIL